MQGAMHVAVMFPGLNCRLRRIPMNPKSGAEGSTGNPSSAYVQMNRVNSTQSVHLLQNTKADCP